MINALKTLEKQNLISKGEKIGVAVSGGIDSMCLLHFLNEQKSQLGFDLSVINIDHNIRENSKNDSEFVKNYCKQNGITFHSFKVDVPEFVKQNKVTVEEGARICRYKVFENLLNKGIVDKIAIAHHRQDQVETILLNIFRGTGLKGASGMDYQSNRFIRPLLDTSKAEIITYAQEHNIAFVEDETNADTDYSRNFIRQEILPKIKEHWHNVEDNIISFSKICKQDDEYINSIINFDNIIVEKNLVKIPLNCFIYKPTITTRIIRYALTHLNALKDFEQKHFAIITNLAQKSENGTKINLPNKLIATKEYDYLTLMLKKPKQEYQKAPFVLGKNRIFGTNIEIKKVRVKNSGLDEMKKYLLEPKTLVFDYDKLPKDVCWRVKQNGDMFQKFSGGTKKLKDYFIDKKVPSRLRNELPLLASQNNILLITGLEISDQIKVDLGTKTLCIIKNN